MSGGELFSHKVKAEAASAVTGRKRCEACLAGMILFSREMSPDGILLQTENRSTRDLFVRLTEHIIGEGSVAVSKNDRGARPPLYSMSVSGRERLASLFDSLGIDPCGPRSVSMIKPPSEQNFGSFAAGVFLSCGSVVSPEKGYHLEFVVPTERLCRELGDMFAERLMISGGTVSRKRASVLYFKESEHIEDILTLIGAPKSSLELMNVKIYRDIRNRVNRATNCDTANCGRQNRSALRQIDAINKIKASKGGLSKLPDELAELARLRLENPEMSLSELCAMFEPPLSRSGVNHRFMRIEQIAKETEV